MDRATQPAWRWSAIAVAGIVLLALIAWLAYARSEQVLQRRYTLAPSAVQADFSPGGIAAGGHLLVVTNCIGCHRSSLTGEMMGLSGSTVYAPNLILAARSMNDAQLDQAIRQGLHTDSTSELGMPSQAYKGFTDAEVGQIIGYLRAQPPQGAQLQRPAPGWLQRINLAIGSLQTEAERIAAAKAPIPAPANDAGRHLAMVACGACHGSDLGGGKGMPGPDLTVRGYYSREQFHTLLRTGVGMDEDMALMSQAAQTSFSHFSDQEIDAIYDYLIDRDQRLAAAAKP